MKRSPGFQLLPAVIAVAFGVTVAVAQPARAVCPTHGSHGADVAELGAAQGPAPSRQASRTSHDGAKPPMRAP